MLLCVFFKKIGIAICTMLMATTATTTVAWCAAVAVARKKTPCSAAFSHLMKFEFRYGVCPMLAVNHRLFRTECVSLRYFCASRRRYHFLNGNRSNRKWIICLHWGERRKCSYAAYAAWSGWNGMWFNFNFPFVVERKLRRNTRSHIH